MLLTTVAAVPTIAAHEWLGIPDVVWAALLTLSGVFLGYWNSRRLLAQQLRHATAEARAARDFQFRRDVYLDAAEAITQAGIILTSLANLNMDEANLDQKNAEIGKKLAKVQLVGGIETVRATAKFQKAFAQGMLKLAPGRFELNHRLTRMATLRNMIDAQIRDKDRWIEQMKLANVQGKGREFMDALMRQFHAAEDMRRQMARDLDQLEQEQVAQHLRFMNACNEANLTVQSLVPDAAVSARRELALDVDAAEYRQISDDMSEAMREAFAQYAQDLRNLDANLRAEFRKAQEQNAPSAPPAQPGPST